MSHTKNYTMSYYALYYELTVAFSPVSRLLLQRQATAAAAAAAVAVAAVAALKMVSERKKGCTLKSVPLLRTRRMPPRPFGLDATLDSTPPSPKT